MKGFITAKRERPIKVYIEEKFLDPKESQAIENHSPDGFNWGYGGSGPAQLALGLMLKFTDEKEMALQIYQAFKWDVIANQPEDQDLNLEIAKIKSWVELKIKELYPEKKYD